MATLCMYISCRVVWFVDSFGIIWVLSLVSTANTTTTTTTTTILWPFVRDYPSVLWCCLLGGRSIQPVKNWVVGCWRGCLGRRADLHMAQLMPLPLISSCSKKMQIGFTFLVPAYPGSPGQNPESCKTVVVVVVMVWNLEPTTSSSSFEFEFELARSFLSWCGPKPSSYLINILICIFA